MVEPVRCRRYFYERWGRDGRRQTLRYLAQGLNNKEIAREMNVSPNTVKAFLKLMMMTMRARSAVIGKVLDLGVKPSHLIRVAASNPLGE